MKHRARTVTQIKRVVKLSHLSALVVAGIIISSCGSNTMSASSSNSPQPVPTVAPIFSAQRPSAFSTITTPDLDNSAPTPNTDRPPSANKIPGRRIAIYDDTLNSNWSLGHTTGAQYNLADTTYVDQGRKALAITPKGGVEGKMLFTVVQGSHEVYKRDHVLGLSLRVSGGTNYLSNDALAVSLQGSNAFPYWVANDTSVKVKGRVTDKVPLFSETRLYYLNINQPVPPNTWVDVVVWLDDLIYDPDYAYVTGFQIKNDKSLRDTYYIDQVSLIVVR